MPSHRLCGSISPWRRLSWLPDHCRTRPKTSLLFLSLLVCGDIQPNPGPKDLCLICTKSVSDEEDGLFCEVCLSWGHRLCVNMTEDEYFHCASVDGGWVCPTCEKEALPFHDISTLSSDSSFNGSKFNTTLNTTSHLDLAKDLPTDQNHAYILVLNARSLLPKIDSLRTLCLSYDPSIIDVNERGLTVTFKTAKCL